ncbi:beta-lactamase family protein [Streptomyces sp. NBC_00237]|uniref:serine hydrolase domain-containing protein n=1 Tax=Streptomyces sp. NBC_00237 TaxID=2975687 RepID=UPI00225BF785|nr:serine hydrolase domain-containing protein [Streptomyces sp. NBC_00237]MCX5205357.1 beta-lactamase family protein [Streptomyces sp. NBC_00237]
MRNASQPARHSVRLTAVATTALLSLSLGVLPATAATPLPAPAAAAAEATSPLDRKALRASLDAIHRAGMYGAYSSVRDGSERWRGATGVADVDTRRPMRAGYEHRIGSITKTFTSVAVLQQVAKGRVDLDAPIAAHLPDLVTGERGRKVTVRMLLNHTSGIADYVLPAFPGILVNPRKALDEGQFRELAPEKLVRLGLAAQPQAPRGTFAYSNTNYLLAGLLLERVTGQDPEAYITKNVIRKAGLRHTYFPRSAYVSGPHARMYESMYGLIEPARDYSVYDMSWAGTAGAMVSTTDDLNDFYRLLLSGKLLGAAELREMKTTVATSPPGQEEGMRYGLGLFRLRMPSGGWYWGHNGSVFGAETWALSTEDGRRQMSLGYNLTKYQELGDDGMPLPNPIDTALVAHMDGALSGVPAKRTSGPLRTPQHLPLGLRLRP